MRSPADLLPAEVRIGCQRVYTVAELCRILGVPEGRLTSPASILGHPDASFFEEDPDNRPFLWDLDPEE